MTTTPKKSVFQSLLSLALPIIGLNVLSVLALAVDTAMCGRLGNSNTVLTALGFATQLIFLLMVAMLGLTVGSVALIARAYGAKDKERVNHILLQSSMLTVFISVLVAIFGNLLADWLLMLLGANEVVRESALLYLRPLLTCTVFYYLNILYAASLRGVGNTRLAFMIALASNGLNVFLNYGLILGNMGFPALGVQGAAIGTVLSHCFSLGLMVFFLRRGAVKDVFLYLKPKAIDKKLFRDLIKIGTPAALDMVILNAAFISIVGMVGRIEQIAVAAHGIGIRIQSLAFVPGMSVSQATGAMVGQALGAGNVEMARKVVRASLLLCTIIMSTLALIIIFGVYPIVSIFDVASGTTLETFSVMWIELLGYCMPIVGIYIAFVGMLRGAGATSISLRINFYATVFFQIPLSALLGFTFGLGVWGVWAAFPISFLLKASWAGVVYRKGDWAKTGIRV